MYVLVISFLNGDVEYVGPFPNLDRALRYGEAAEKEYNKLRFPVRVARWFGKELTVPHAVVRSILWRAEEKE